MCRNGQKQKRFTVKKENSFIEFPKIYRGFRPFKLLYISATRTAPGLARSCNLPKAEDDEGVAVRLR
jgi:hypothetical protein